MSRMSGGLVALSVLLSSGFAWAGGTAPDLVDETVRARKCDAGNCRFSFDTVDLEIAGVGDPAAQFAVYAANIQKTWAAFGLGHGCAMVKRMDTLVIAFISPKNAKVYRDWSACSRADKSGR